jgi:hypothetical protein
MGQPANNIGCSWVDWNLVFGKLLFIFQMPKTGSQTVEASLQDCAVGEQILRCHFLSRQRIAELQGVLGQAGSSAWRQQVEEQICFSKRLSRILRIRNLLRLCKIKIPKLKVITAVREPVSLGLSSIFQNSRYFVPQPDALSAELCNEILQRPRMLSSLEDWFDLELKPVTGVDVFQTPFAYDRGFAIYENSRARVLLYRFEALQQLDGILREFLGQDVPRIVSRNLSQDKAYRPHYDRVKRHIRLPLEFLMRRYQSRLACHFYSPRELAGFVRRWSGGAENRDETPRWPADVMTSPNPDTP